MPLQTEHRFPLDQSVLDAAGSRVTLAGLRHQARAVAEYFMRTGTRPVCIGHARTLARLHRTLLLHHSGIMPVDSAGFVRCRLATALPTGSFDGPTLQAAIDRL